MLKQWDALPQSMRTDAVRPYYESLRRHRFALAVKRLFDVLVSLVLLVVLAVPMLVIAILIRAESKGPVIFRQQRVTTNGKLFRIHKFRTMVTDAERLGAAVTVDRDPRITAVGAGLRRMRLDELPQLLDVLAGNMSFVGTRPEVPKYVAQYRPEYMATLLLPAGITSEASIRFKDEDVLLRGAEDVDAAYLSRVLPAKMQWNLLSVRRFSLLGELRTMVRTVAAMLGRQYPAQPGEKETFHE